jgi:serine/threonine protein kinase
VLAAKIFRSEDEMMFIHAEREHQILSRLNVHLNIVQGIDYIPELLRNRGYLIMEKISGVSILNTVLD